jgi:RHS repeat-associated protein
MVDKSANVQDTISYGAFGNIRAETGSGDRFKFTAREWDSEIGLYFVRARYFDPTTGRWIIEDPLKFKAGDVNLYRYVGNHPLTGTDPSGEDLAAAGCGFLAGGIAGAASGAAAGFTIAGVYGAGAALGFALGPPGWTLLGVVGMSMLVGAVLTSVIGAWEGGMKNIGCVNGFIAVIADPNEYLQAYVVTLLFVSGWNALPRTYWPP